MTLHASHQLAELVRAAVRDSGRRQYLIAARAGVTSKHLSRVVNGHAGAHLDTAEAILNTCGQRLILTVEPIPAEDP